MKSPIISAAKSKWFVPAVIFIMIIIALSSFTSKSKTATTTSNTELKIEELCNSIEGVSNAKVIITYSPVEVSTFFAESKESEKILGIAVLCKGGDDPNIKLKLYQILNALFKLPSNRIAISERN